MGERRKMKGKGRGDTDMNGRRRREVRLETKNERGKRMVRVDGNVLGVKRENEWGWK